MFRRRCSKSVCDVYLIHFLRPGVWEVTQSNSTVFLDFLVVFISQDPLLSQMPIVQRFKQNSFM